VYKIKYSPSWEHRDHAISESDLESGFGLRDKGRDRDLPQ
jgi:hypothetical protein